MGKYIKCFSCTYCLQDCCSCLYSTRFRRMIGYLFCLPCWDHICHVCHKHCCASLSCTSSCTCMKGSYLAHLCDCCTRDNFTLEISDNSLQINHYTNMSKEGNDGELTVPSTALKHKHPGSPAITRQPARVRFQLDEEVKQCDISEEQTTEVRIQDSAAILPSQPNKVTENQEHSETKDMLGNTVLNTEIPVDGTGDGKSEATQKQYNVSTFISDDCHRTNILVTDFKQTSV